MGETDTDAADRFDARVAAAPLDERMPTLWQRYRRLPRNVFTISLVSLLNDASSEIIYPLLPLFLAGTLGASPRIIGLIEGGAESVSSFLKLFAGYASDREGRRKPLVVVGYGLAGFARPLLAFAQTWPQAFGIRLADRVGKGLRSAPRDAMIADATPPVQRGLAFGFHRAMDHGGAVIGPLLSFALLFWLARDASAPTIAEYKTVFLCASVPALAALLVAIFFVRETHAAAAPNPAEPPPRFTLRGFDRNFYRFLVLVALFTLSNSSDAFLLLRARDAGISAALIPLLWAALHACKVLSSLLGGDLSDRVGRKVLIIAGWLLYAAVYAGFAFVTTAWAAWALFLVYGIYFGLCEGTEKALVADLVRAEQRGTAYGLYNLAFSSTVWPASLLMGAVWDWHGPRTAFLLSAVLGAFAAMLLALTVRAGTETAPALAEP
jgi:MFS family permease